METGDEAPGPCPYCGGKLEWLERGNDNFVRYCPRFRTVCNWKKNKKSRYSRSAESKPDCREIWHFRYFTVTQILFLKVLWTFPRQNDKLILLSSRWFVLLSGGRMESILENPLALKPYERTSFEDSLERVSVDPGMPLLPLLHTVGLTQRTGREDPIAADYFSTGCILPIPCDIFGENLIYTFVGRPVFPEFQRPVCFLLKPEPELLQNLFVFDTGAYATNRYGTIVENKTDINRFRIPARADAIRRFIAWEFGDNERYYYGLSKDNREFHLMNSQEEFDYSILKKILAYDRMNFDSRCRTLENIIRTPIPLQYYLQGVILPESRKEDAAFREFCSRPLPGFAFDIILYDDEQGRADAKTCNSRLDTALFMYYVDKGFI